MVKCKHTKCWGIPIKKCGAVCTNFDNGQTGKNTMSPLEVNNGQTDRKKHYVSPSSAKT
jgi:hypothetical protein